MLRVKNTGSTILSFPYLYGSATDSYELGVGDSTYIESWQALRLRENIKSGYEISQDGNLNSNSNTIAGVTTSNAQTILSANTQRKGFEIQNKSELDLYVSFGVDCTVDNGFRLAPGMYYSPVGCVSTALISVLGSQAGQKFTYIQY